MKRLMHKRTSRLLLAILFVTAGALHFVLPARYAGTIPPWLPAPGVLVVISGLCEIAGGLGVLWHATRRWAGYGLIALCLAVLPANVQMLLDAQSSGASAAWQGLLWIRLPLQLVLIAWIWAATREDAVDGEAGAHDRQG